MTEIERVLLDGIPALYAAAQNGDAHNALVSMRRILEQLRTVQPGLADSLKGRLLTASPPSATNSFVLRGHSSPPVDRETSAGLLRHMDAQSLLAPVMTPPHAAVLKAFVEEHRQAARLAAAGLAPRSTLFLAGPPGVGKTMTASWLARELHLPLFQLEIPAIVSSYLGRTGQNLREVFDFARITHGVVLLDEFDAIAKRRDDTADIGEMRRIVNVLLKEIEDWPGPGILIAATNHADLIDPAIFRRFQVVLRLSQPDKDVALEILRIHFGVEQPSPGTLELASSLLTGKSGSAIRDVVLESRRRLALGRSDSIDEAILGVLASIPASAAERRLFARAARRLGRRMTMDRIAALLGVSKGTVHYYLHEGKK